MAEINAVLGSVCSGLQEAADKCGLSLVYPEGADRHELPVRNDGGRLSVEYAGSGKAAKIEYYNGKITLFGASKDGDILPSDFSQIAQTLFEVENAEDKDVDKDVRYTVNDFSDTLIETFAAATQKQVKAKLPTPVSKAAAKSGAVSYDPNTLASRLTAIIPELREPYRQNCERYGQFLPEDFFINHGNKAVIDIIKRNDKTEMNRLFKLFNEIYDDGTNETQSVIAVTILGSLENNQELLANCVDYMNDSLTQVVISVNKYLWSKDGKGARMKLENPPIYKPKKKSKGIASKIGM